MRKLKISDIEGTEAADDFNSYWERCMQDKKQTEANERKCARGAYAFVLQMGWYLDTKGKLRNKYKDVPPDGVKTKEKQDIPEKLERYLA